LASTRCLADERRWTFERGPTTLLREHPGLLDSLFLAAVAWLSLSLYVTRLGFHSDDWAFLGTLTNSADQSLGGLISTEWQSLDLFHLRPTQVIYQALLYLQFGADPLGYHLVNGAMLVAVTLLFYWVLRELLWSRLLAVCIPLVFVLLPSFSTDRFWFASFGYVLTLAAYFLSLYSDLRAIRAGSRHALIVWKAVALLMVAVAGLGYEVVIPLLVLNMPVVWAYARRGDRGGLRARLGKWGARAYVGSHYLVLGAVVIYKSLVATGPGPDMDYLFHLARLLVGSLLNTYGTYLVALPHTAVWAVLHASAGTLSAGAFVGVGVFVYLLWLVRSGKEPVPGRREWLAVGVAGVAVFAAGYAIALISGRIGFSSTGILNRSAIVASIGVATTIVAVLGLVFSIPSRERIRHWGLAGALAFICAIGFITINVLADDWADAWIKEQATLARIETTLPSISSDSTLILHGVCPYVGPAIVFESSWDLAGALQVRYRDATLAGDITSSRLAITPDGLQTTIYGGKLRVYPYGPKLLLFDDRNGAVVPLLDDESAREVLRRHPIPTCNGEPGRGEVLLPMERLYVKWLRDPIP